MPTGKPNLLPCKHGIPVTLQRTEPDGTGHWIIANDCCESHIDWDRHRLTRSWNTARKGGGDA